MNSIHGTLMVVLLLCNSGVKCMHRTKSTKAHHPHHTHHGQTTLMGAPHTMNAGQSESMQSRFDYREQYTPDPYGPPKGHKGAGAVGPHGMAHNMMFDAGVTTTVVQMRTMPERASQAADCDYLAHYCLRAYRTGRLCGRTLYYNYKNFTNYCLLDYVNCKEGYEVWQVAHMDYCYNIEVVPHYGDYDYRDDNFLDSIYVYDGW